MKLLPSILVVAVSVLPLYSQFEPPESYYSPVTGLSGQDLKIVLHGIIDDHTKLPYTSTSTDVWDALEALDEDPNNQSNVLTFYSNESIPKADKDGSSNAAVVWNREHTWPQSYGFSGKESWPAFTDLHHLRASRKNYNSSRGNDFYDNGGTDVWEAANSPSDNLTDSDSWEVWDGRKGDAARGLFYLAIRYEGDAPNEPDLLLSNIAPIAGEPRMGLLNTLLEWHAKDPVDDSERARNHTIFENYQGNRNPFIDHPEFAASIWQNSGESDTMGGILAEDVFISQYIEGSGFNKSIELFNGTGEAVDLSPFSLELYSNGKTGDPSQSLNLNGVLLSGEVLVISNEGAVAAIQAETDLINNSTINFNGNDAIALRKNGEIIDLIGIIGDADDFAKDINLIRQVHISSGNPQYDPFEWLGISDLDDFSGLGEHLYFPEIDLPKVVVSSITPSKLTVEVTAKEGQVYAVHYSNDLTNWTLLPLLQIGIGEAQRYEFDWSSRFFVMVNPTVSPLGN